MQNKLSPPVQQNQKSSREAKGDYDGARQSQLLNKEAIHRKLRHFVEVDWLVRRKLLMRRKKIWMRLNFLGLMKTQVKHDGGSIVFWECFHSMGLSTNPGTLDPKVWYVYIIGRLCVVPSHGLTYHAPKRWSQTWYSAQLKSNMEANCNCTVPKHGSGLLFGTWHHRWRLSP